MSDKVVMLKREQYQYIHSIGGYPELKESDCTNNDMNRAIIRAFYENNDSTYVGVINARNEMYEKIKKNENVEVLKKYNNEKVCNFEYDFIVPVKDEILENFIVEWNKEHSPKILDALFDRIKEINGVNFIWS